MKKYTKKKLNEFVKNKLAKRITNYDMEPNRYIKLGYAGVIFRTYLLLDKITGELYIA